MSDLVIIEAVGKKKYIENIFTELGYDVHVFATKGHVCSLPKSLSPVGIDKNCKETSRETLNPWVEETIIKEALECTNIYIATDADQEGDVIAWDVYQWIKNINSKIFRIKLKGMDAKSVKEAIDSATFINKQDAVPGRTRAIVDRLIGSAFSQSGVGVGRVSTGVLGLVASGNLSTKSLKLMAPALDGGTSFIAECPINEKDVINLKTAEKLEREVFPALDVNSRSKPFTGDISNMGDLMVKAGDQMNLSPKESEESLQNLYERGQMSYPRAESRTVSDSMQDAIEKSIKRAGFKFDKKKLPEKQTDSVHDAPIPTGDNFDVGLDPCKMGQEEGILVLSARELVKAGQEHVNEFSMTEPIRKHLLNASYSHEVVDYITNLPWLRTNGPKYPGKVKWQQSEIKTRRADVVLLETMVKAGIGRPSTYASHVERFIEKNLVDENLDLTAKGKEWLEKSPAELINPKMSGAIERACEKILKTSSNENEPWEILADKIIHELPKNLQTKIINAQEDVSLEEDYKDSEDAEFKDEKVVELK